MYTMILLACGGDDPALRHRLEALADQACAVAHDPAFAADGQIVAGADVMVAFAGTRAIMASELPETGCHAAVVSGDLPGEQGARWLVELGEKDRPSAVKLRIRHDEADGRFHILGFTAL